ncbi:formyltetrahydrofolate deformylase [Burkholderia multivorans]|uniref:formyltetrahydrofolate deformylase n=1 Tax=Burkholderia multivorans TaxID=87883 RepID=UPI000278081A|nr:formyltetrahydrofolate deformylase [Burkholderia multivorans]EJO54179.1 formyltetrahydrofolate deformylase [Burkholderia multivorans CF2]MBJ9657244.1 formyltetrahydrofolate deformylase [Burkholderia multivorans]MBR8046464.1 formyltetrahydrofolate deformylase [Burkholderia multivorans]MBR8122556.1 formyltetrahydrofolate deformylase [Burkholderia multivorans]MBR8338510.1 formyltetrahydrofolate deformylase [Burkholderia multivorans]
MTDTVTKRADRPSRFALTVTCPSAPGQVAALVRFLDERGCYIDEFDVFDDEFTTRFFVRCIFHATSAHQLDVNSLRDGFSAIAGRFDMSWAIHDMSMKPKVLIMVSKFDHCLADLLFRWRMDELKMDIVGVASNHPDLAPLARANGIPYHHLPLTTDTKPQQEANVLALIERSGAELVVLARYMQVLSADLSARLAGRAINIHHSFLPGFKGAKPYHQAHARGVKLIGATAHFVTDDLDEGPIIEQVVERVTHAYDPEQLLATGRDVECLALARAVKLFVERRIFINGSRTVVLQ